MRMLAGTQNLASIGLALTLVVFAGVLLIACFSLHLWPSGQKFTPRGDAHDAPLSGPPTPPAAAEPPFRQPPDFAEGKRRPAQAELPAEVVLGPAARRRQRVEKASGGCPHLCQGLVVPRGSDCVLAVRPAARSGAACAVDISDLRGKPVLKAHVSRPHYWGKVDEKVVAAMGWNFSNRPAVRLCMLDAVSDEQRGRPDDKALALCQSGSGSDGRPAMFVYDSDGHYFGCLAKAACNSRYVFTTHAADDSIYFDGLFANRSVCVSSPSQPRVAETEPCRMAFDLQNEFYQLRCGGTADVGLVVCCLLAIDEIEASAPKR